MAVSQVLRTDYGALGILLIVVLAYGRNHPIQLWAGSATLVGGGILLLHTMDEIFAPIGLALCHLYNHKHGLKLKYTSYAFYPLHLLVLGIMKMLMAKA